MASRLPDPCLVVLVGPAGCGKSTWAEAIFGGERVVSSYGLRAMVGTGARDQRAGKAAFEVLDLIVDHRLRRGLTTVVDATSLEPARRAAYVKAARRRKVAVVAVVFDVPEREVRRRNRERADPVPSAVVTSQLRALPAAVAAIPDEGFDAVIAPGPVALVPPHLVDAPIATQRQKEDPMPLRFGLQVPSFAWPGGTEDIAPRLAAIAEEAEAAGFASLWLMDHFVQMLPLLARSSSVASLACSNAARRPQKVASAGLAPRGLADVDAGCSCGRR